MQGDKVTRQVIFTFNGADAVCRGYEIHMGNTELHGKVTPFSVLSGGIGDGAVCGNVFGSYVHGLFDGGLGEALVNLLLERKGLSADSETHMSNAQHQEQQFDLIALALRENFDMAAIYRIIKVGV